MTKTILAFGDSNTFGSKPMKLRHNPKIDRFESGIRWPGVVAKSTGWDVIEAGLPGRTATALPDATMGDHMNGPMGLKIALNSCGPIDALALMLGTNDQKTQFGLDAKGITSAISALISIAKSADVQAKHSGFEILLICPPAVKEVGVLKEDFFGAEAKSAALPDLLAALADNWDIDYLNANSIISVSDIDGVHFEADSQKALGQAIGAGLNASLV